MAKYTTEELLEAFKEMTQTAIPQDLVTHS